MLFRQVRGIQAHLGLSHQYWRYILGELDALLSDWRA